MGSWRALSHRIIICFESHRHASVNPHGLRFGIRTCGRNYGSLRVRSEMLREEETARRPAYTDVLNASGVGFSER